MAVISKSEDISKSEEKIIDLLKKSQGSMSVDKLVNKLFQEHKISEREVKEAIWDLLEKGKITPDTQWKMKIRS
jgi:hypothetical protein